MTSLLTSSTKVADDAGHAHACSLRTWGESAAYEAALSPIYPKWLDQIKTSNSPVIPCKQVAQLRTLHYELGATGADAVSFQVRPRETYEYPIKP
jgi:hypothetical protein